MGAGITACVTLVLLGDRRRQAMPSSARVCEILDILDCFWIVDLRARVSVFCRYSNISGYIKFSGYETPALTSGRHAQAHKATKTSTSKPSYRRISPAGATTTDAAPPIAFRYVGNARSCPSASIAAPSGDQRSRRPTETRRPLSAFSFVFFSGPLLCQGVEMMQK